MAPVDKAQDEARSASRTREVSRRIHQRLEQEFGEGVTLVDAIDPYTVVARAEIFLEIMKFLKTSLLFDFLRSVSGVDYPDSDSGRIASVYHLYSYASQEAHVVKLYCDRARPEAPSVHHLWPSAGWFEREAYDLLGIVYLGHPDLRRILLPDDWIGHPLRKDYVEAPDYHGIGTTRASPLDAFARMDEARRRAREARGELLPPAVPSPVKPPEGWIAPPRRQSGITDPEGGNAG